MDPKANPTCNTDVKNGVPEEVLWRSTHNPQGVGGALRQLELIQSHQTAPRVPQNEEAQWIHGTLGQQPKNMFAPLNKSRKVVKESEVRGIP